MGHAALVLIVSLSFLLQLSTIVAALSLIRVTGWKASWSLVSLGILTMGVRRLITLFQLLSGETSGGKALLYESVGLAGSLVMLLGVLAIRPAFTALKNAARKRQELIDSLQSAQAQVKLLRGILPICSYCKRILDDRKSWERMETYISEHSEAQFSHGLCPECARKYYPDIKLNQE